MLHTLHYPREFIVERVVFTPADHTQIALCRGAHNRLGFAYQMGFLRLTGRFPAQQPLEILDALLAFVASELAIDPTTIQAYAQRRQTISAHQEHVRLHLGFRWFGPTERERLSAFVYDEATHVEHTSALLARAEEFLRDHQILVPAVSTLRRLVGEQQERARHTLFAHMMEFLPTGMQARLDALLHVEADHRVSPLQFLKEPPGLPSPHALIRLTTKLDYIHDTGVLALDLAWLNNNLHTALARQALPLSAYR